MNIRKLLREELLKVNEDYNSVGVENIKTKKPKLTNYKNFTDKISDDKFTYLNFSGKDFSTEEFSKILVFDNQDGTEVANCFYGYDEDGKLKGAVDVRPDKRRMGIGSKMYEWIEVLKQDKIHPDLPHSKDAEKFWGNPNKKFGN